MREAGGPVGSCNQIRAKKRGRDGPGVGCIHVRSDKRGSKGDGRMGSM